MTTHKRTPSIVKRGLLLQVAVTLAGLASVGYWSWPTIKTKFEPDYTSVADTRLVTAAARWAEESDAARIDEWIARRTRPAVCAATPPEESELPGDMGSRLMADAGLERRVRAAARPVFELFGCPETRGLTLLNVNDEEHLRGHPSNTARTLEDGQIALSVDTMVMRGLSDELAEDALNTITGIRHAVARECFRQMLAGDADRNAGGGYVTLARDEEGAKDELKTIYLATLACLKLGGEDQSLRQIGRNLSYADGHLGKQRHYSSERGAVGAEVVKTTVEKAIDHYRDIHREEAARNEDKVGKVLRWAEGERIGSLREWFARRPAPPVCAATEASRDELPTDIRSFTVDAPMRKRIMNVVRPVLHIVGCPEARGVVVFDDPSPGAMPRTRQLDGGRIALAVDAVYGVLDDGLTEKVHHSLTNMRYVLAREILLQTLAAEPRGGGMGGDVTARELQALYLAAQMCLESGSDTEIVKRLNWAVVGAGLYHPRFNIMGGAGAPDSTSIGAVFAEAVRNYRRPSSVKKGVDR